MYASVVPLVLRPACSRHLTAAWDPYPYPSRSGRNTSAQGSQEPVLQVIKTDLPLRCDVIGNYPDEYRVDLKGGKEQGEAGSIRDSDGRMTGLTVVLSSPRFSW
jgi:hypothetical protein